jgi:hypothetical protein
MVNIELLEEYASLFLTIDEIAILLNADAESLRREIRHGKNETAVAYQRGKLKTIVEIRKQQVMFAKKGSPSAENLLNGYLIKQQKNE